MLDAILRSKFYCKCKAEIKLTKRRIEIIKRKRNAMQKFLRNDVADLLKNGLDSNAYGRVEQLYVDQNLSTCYEFVEQSCLLILNHLSAMDKQRECPEECKEAIPTLMFAAARFADLPELRELRSLFSERYGNCLEPYVNKEFFKNMKADTPTEDIKHLMMLEIKLEYDIEWDNKALEQKLYKPPPLVQRPIHSEPLNHSEVAKDRNNESLKPHHHNGLETNVQKTENKHSYKPAEAAKKEQSNGKSLAYKSRAEIEKKEVVEVKAEVSKVKESHGRGSPYWSSNSSGSSSESTTSQDESASEDGIERRKFYASLLRSTPPPYLKPDSKCEDENTQSASEEGRKLNSLRSVGPPYIKTDSAKSSEASSNITPKPVPRSMRIRRPLKPVAGSHHQVSNGDHDHDHRDEEEEEDRKPIKLGCDSREVHAPTRITSLPAESLGEAIEERKGLTRAATYDMNMNSRGGHVHPKLPDYDDFVARLAAFRAGS